MAQYQIDNVAAPIDFQGSDRRKRTLQNAKNLLMCRMGEVPYERYMGFDPSLFNLPTMEFQEALLPEIDRILLWEPEAEAVDAEATLLPDGSVYIKVILEVV